MEQERYRYYTLPNGIRIVHKEVLSPVAHVGVMVNAGSRDETEEEHGLAHFIEHTFFKGTQKRKAFHVISRLDKVGAELNAFTSKEDTMIYASFMKEYYKRALELLSDIVFHSVFPSHELQKEKDVILDEIDSYKEEPAEMIFDQFESELFSGHPLGRNILGPKKNIRKFSRRHVMDFLRQNYHTDQIVISSVGNLAFDKFLSWVRQFFGDIPSSIRKTERVPFSGYRPFNLSYQKKGYQNHCVIGNEAYSYFDKEKKQQLSLLNNLLGGTGMNSRLNLSIRERKGYAYQVESNYLPYTDSGLFIIYIGCNNGYLDKSLELVYKELELLRKQKLGPLQLQMAKNQYIGQMVIQYDSNLNEMVGMAKSQLLFDEVKTTADVAREIEAITAEQLLEVAEEIFHPDRLSALIYKKR